MRVRVDDDAQVEVSGARICYRARSRDQSKAFAVELRRIRRLLGEYPEAGALVFRGHRRFLMDGFPYAVHYRLEGQYVLIVAVAHTSRRPGYWLNR